MRPKGVTDHERLYAYLAFKLAQEHVQGTPLALHKAKGSGHPFYIEYGADDSDHRHAIIHFGAVLDKVFTFPFFERAQLLAC